MAKLAALAPLLAGGSAISTPLLLGSLAATVGGSLLANREQRKAASRRNEGVARVAAEEDKRREQLDQQSQAALDQLSQKHTEPVRAEKVADTTDRLTDVIAPEAVDSVPALPGQGRTSQTVKEDAARQLSTASAKVRDRLSALAKLSAYDLTDQDLGVARARSATGQNARANQYQGSLTAQGDANGYLQQEYENFTPSPLSSLLSGAGQLGSLYAGSMGSGGATMPRGRLTGDLQAP